MTTLTFEDFAPGRFGSFGPRHVTREEILAFAAEFDPQPLELATSKREISFKRGEFFFCFRLEPLGLGGRGSESIT